VFYKNIIPSGLCSPECLSLFKELHNSQIRRCLKESFPFIILVLEREDNEVLKEYVIYTVI
ncbi:MAG: hypothetical protein KDC25_11770, partial [Saprospiraceae bacterium]|nr:hypothetical protein [Saprospiraceae bacterium]